MREATKLLVIMCIMFGYIPTLYAQESASTTARISATITNPTSVSKTADIYFGDIVPSPTDSSTVTMTPEGVSSSTGSARMPSTKSTGTAATFSIGGETTKAYTITIPKTTLTITNGTDTMKANVIVSKPSANGTLGIGATIHVKAGQPAGTYVAKSFNVAVNYN